MSSASADVALDTLLDTILHHYHYDFRSYARASLRRRVRLAAERLHEPDLEGLTTRIVRDADAFTLVLNLLTVPVSDVFRDPEYYVGLRKHVAPMLQTYPSIKVWVAGCSTGEEVYSLAIMLHEEGLLDRTIMYATDINPASLRAAQAGAYALDRFRTFSENYQLAGGKASLADYYSTSERAAVFDRALRKQVVFSDHSLATDSVFAEVQLVSCRNVLIYFDRELQDRSVGLFTRALCRQGFLGLGMRETLRFGAFAGAYEPVDADVRIFRKRLAP